MVQMKKLLRALSLSLSVSLPLALCVSLSKDGTDEQIAESSHFEQKDGTDKPGVIRKLN